MSFKIDSIHGVFTCDELALNSTANIFIPGLCKGTIPHSMKLAYVDIDHAVLLVAKPGVFTELSLIIESVRFEKSHQGIEVVTNVFNMSNSRVRIAKGHCISSLVSFKLA